MTAFSLFFVLQILKKRNAYDENVFAVGILTPPAASSLFPPERREFITRRDGCAKNNSNNMNSFKQEICSDGKVGGFFRSQSLGLSSRQMLNLSSNGAKKKKRLH